MHRFIERRCQKPNKPREKMHRLRERKYQKVNNKPKERKCADLEKESAIKQTTQREKMYKY